MATQLTDREMSELTEIYQLYDSAGDGKVGIAFAWRRAKGFDLNPTEAEISKIKKEVDPEGTHRISFEEFIPMFQSVKGKARHKVKQEDFVDSLKVFDNDASGFINAGELRHVLTSIGERLTDEQVDVLFQSIETNQGQVNYEDFVKSVMSG